MLNNIVRRLLLGILLLTSTAYAEETYDLYGAFALTGLAAPFGNHEKNGVLLAIEDFNKNNLIDGKKANLIAEDTMGDNAHSLTAINKLISLDKAKVIIGPTWADSYQSPLVTANQKKVFLFTPSAVVQVFKKTPADYPYVFSNIYSLSLEADVLFKEMKKRGVKRIIIAFDNDPFFQYMQKEILVIAKNIGIEILYNETFDIGASDFKSYLAKIKKINPDAILVGLGDEKSLFTFFKQRAEFYPELPVYSFDYLEPYFENPEWKPYDKNITWASPKKVDKAFEAKYSERFKVKPNYGAYLSYDTAMVTLQAAKDGAREAESFRKYLLSNTFDSVMYGKLKFNEYGGVDVGEFEVRRN